MDSKGFTDVCSIMWVDRWLLSLNALPQTEQMNGFVCTCVRCCDTWDDVCWNRSSFLKKLFEQIEHLKGLSTV